MPQRRQHRSLLGRLSPDPCREALASLKRRPPLVLYRPLEHSTAQYIRSHGQHSIYPHWVQYRHPLAHAHTTHRSGICCRPTKRGPSSRNSFLRWGFHESFDCPSTTPLRLPPLLALPQRAHRAALRLLFEHQSGPSPALPYPAQAAVQSSLQPHGRPVVRNAAARIQTNFGANTHLAREQHALLHDTHADASPPTGKWPICRASQSVQTAACEPTASRPTRAPSTSVWPSVASRGRHFPLLLLQFPTEQWWSVFAVLPDKPPYRCLHRKCLPQLHARPWLLEAMEKSFRTGARAAGWLAGRPTEPFSQTTCARHIR
ncbi:hypothetical protein HDK64DRAFT_281900 [Phyllosticta capitalensis]